MAVKTYTVQKGDTLYGIAKKNNTTVSAIAKWNDIEDVSFIVIDQKLQIPDSTSTTPPAATTPEPQATKAVVNVFGLQSNTDRTIYATWKWDRENTTEYETKWYYDSGDGIWFVGTESTVKVKQALYNAPSNAKRVRFVVKPVCGSKTKKWTAEWSDEKIYNFTDNPPTAPSFSDSNVKMEEHKLTVELDNLNVNGTGIEFEVVRDNTKVYATKSVNIVMGRVAHTFTIAVGSVYKVRCRSFRGKIYSAWTDYTKNFGTMPSAPAGIITCKATSSTSVYLEWHAVTTATSYDIEYTTKKEYFNGSDGTTTIGNIESPHYEKIGLEMGEEYFFRVRSVNDSGKSSWSEIKSIVLGKKPISPTTWSSATTVMTGEPLVLYWVHNAEDGSSQKYAELELYIDGVLQEPTTIIQNSTDEDEKDKTSSYSIDTSEYNEGTTLQWRVRTSGITNVLGDWSIQRTVDIYAPATLELSMLDSANNAINVLTSLPFYISGLAGPNTQRPIGYHLSIVADEMYETVDNVGNAKIVNKGDEVYSQYFDISDTLNVTISAKDISLENNMSYTVNGSVSMNSGLVAESSLTFTVTWDTVSYKPDVAISIDEEALTATINPYCEKRNVVFYKVDNTSGYSVTTEVIDASNLTHVYTETGERVYLRSTSYGLGYYCIKHVAQNDILVPTYYTVTKSGDVYSTSSVTLQSSGITGIYTTDGKEVLLGATLDNVEVYYCQVIESELLEGVMLSVYRRGFDGGFTEIIDGIDNAPNLNVTDPHPALDYARYRVVATSKTTGAVSYYDAPGHPVGGKAAVIQWDEDWINYEAENGDALAVGPWKGSMLKLPYNIDISNSHKPDVALVKYIGREHPVSYYGTQLGHTSTWKMDIERSDKETIHAIRRLANWKGDVYVREPSGSGYWAHVTVSFDDNHCEVIIPLSLDITRVEGGV